MNLDMLVCPGQPPWQPNSEAHDLDAWHRYDFPTAGTYKLGDDLVLYTVIGDTAEHLSVWAYVPVFPGDRPQLEKAEFSSPSDMRAFIEGMFANREATFGLAEDLRIWRWTRQPVGSGEDNLVVAATAALSEMVKVLTDEAQVPPAADVMFQAELAQAEVTTRDLVDA